MNARARNLVAAWSGILGTLPGTHALVEIAATDSAERHCCALGGLRHVP